MPPHIETEKSKPGHGISARLIEHPYFKIMQDWFIERDIDPQSVMRQSDYHVMMSVILTTPKKESLTMFLRMYESDEIYFWMGALLGKIEASQKKEIVRELNLFSEFSKSTLRFGLDGKDRVLVSFRGKASVLNPGSFEKVLSGLDYFGWLMRNKLIEKGYSLTHDKNDSNTKRENEMEGAK